MITPYQIGRRAHAGVRYVNVIDCGDGVRIHRRFLKDGEVIGHARDLLERALYELVQANEIADAKKIPQVCSMSVEELARQFFHETTGEGSACNDFDRYARIVEKVQEALALLNFIYGEDVFCIR